VNNPVIETNVSSVPEAPKALPAPVPVEQPKTKVVNNPKPVKQKVKQNSTNVQPSSGQSSNNNAQLGDM
jgi:hypothetical protein